MSVLITVCLFFGLLPYVWCVLRSICGTYGSGKATTEASRSQVKPSITVLLTFHCTRDTRFPDRVLMASQRLRQNGYYKAILSPELKTRQKHRTRRSMSVGSNPLSPAKPAFVRPVARDKSESRGRSFELRVTSYGHRSRPVKLPGSPPALSKAGSLRLV